LSFCAMPTFHREFDNTPTDVLSPANTCIQNRVINIAASQPQEFILPAYRSWAVGWSATPSKLNTRGIRVCGANWSATELS